MPGKLPVDPSLRRSASQAGVRVGVRLAATARSLSSGLLRQEVVNRGSDVVAVGKLTGDQQFDCLIAEFFQI